MGRMVSRSRNNVIFKHHIEQYHIRDITDIPAELKKLTGWCRSISRLKRYRKRCGSDNSNWHGICSSSEESNPVPIATRYEELNLTKQPTV